MKCRGKRLVSLVLKEDQKQIENSILTNNADVGQNIDCLNGLNHGASSSSTTGQGNNILPRNTSVPQNECDVNPSTSLMTQGNDWSDDEKILENYYGDVSDSEDPTYQPESKKINEGSKDGRPLVELDDLLEQSHDHPLDQFDAALAEGLELLENMNQQQKEAADTAQVTDRSVAQVILTEIMDKVWKTVKPLKRWRTPNPGNWAVNIAKKRRAEGLPYKVRSKDRPAKVPKEVDCSRCKFKCAETFSETKRNNICRHFWNMDYKGRKNFILACVSVEQPKKVLAIRTQRAQRSYAKKCYFNDGNEKVQVCQNFYCKTLCIAPAVIVDAIKKKTETGLFEEEDHRGDHEPKNKTSSEAHTKIRRHIESYPCMESHYTRKDTRRKYLSPGLSIKKMYFHYKEMCEAENTEAVSEITYRRVFSNEYNLSFFIPKKDQCPTCSNFNNAESDKKAELEAYFTEHIKRKNMCNLEKEKDKERANNDPTFCSVTFDLQAVLQVPNSEVSLIYYSRKMCVYNLTIYEAALPNNAYCFLWYEINGKKGSCEIGSILFHYLTECVPSHISEISLFSDTCGGQNRNQFVAALLLWAVHNIDHLQIIEQKFLESGHTNMEADSMHSSIESAKKHTSAFTIHDWISICKRARRKRTEVIDGKKITKEPYTTKEFKYNEFYDLKELANTMIKNKAKDELGNKVKWLKIKRLRYVKGEKRIYFNYDMTETFNYIDVTGGTNEQSVTTRKRIKKNAKRNINNYSHHKNLPKELKKAYSHQLPISEQKKKTCSTYARKELFPKNCIIGSMVL